MTPREPESIFRYRRARVVVVGQAVFVAALFAVVAWVAAVHHNLDEVVPWLAVLAIGVGIFVAVWIYLNRAIVLSDLAVSESGPFKRSVSIPWNEIARVARFERDKQTDIVPRSGTRKITIGDGIDRFQELQEAILRKVADRYSVERRRPEALRRRLIIAGVSVAVIVGAALIVPHDRLVGWPFHGRVTAVILDPTGAVVPQASVSIFNKRTGYQRVELEGSKPMDVTLPAGKYAVAIQSPLYRTKSIAVDVEFGRTQSLEIRLERLER